MKEPRLLGPSASGLTKGALCAVMRPWRSSLVAAALAIAGASAQASTNYAALQDINFTFVDLNPLDGIGPSLQDVGVESGYLVLLDGYYPGGPGLVTEGFLTAGDGGIPYEVPLGAGAVGSMSPGRISVQAEATGAGTAQISGMAGGNYFLTPYSSVTLTADAVLQGIGDAGNEDVSVCLSACEQVGAFVSGMQTHSFSLTYSNDTSQYSPVNMSVTVDAFASGVPELPASILLLTSGLLFAWPIVNCRLRRPGGMYKNKDAAAC